MDSNPFLLPIADTDRNSTSGGKESKKKVSHFVERPEKVI